MIGIYKITSPSNKIYIGQSWDIEFRWNYYSTLNCKSQRKIYNSLVKYGVDQHKFEVLLDFEENITQDYLDHCEQFFMDYYRDEGFELMNLREGGGYGKMSVESKEKMSKSQRGKKLSEETKKRMSLSHKGKIKSKEHKQNLSISLFGRKLSEEHKKKLSLSHNGVKRGPQPIVKCPHCDKEGGSSTMKQHHFEKCKIK
jgi:group I intron endonuclease